MDLFVYRDENTIERMQYDLTKQSPILLKDTNNHTAHEAFLQKTNSVPNHSNEVHSSAIVQSTTTLVKPEPPMT